MSVANHSIDEPQPGARALAPARAGPQRRIGGHRHRRAAAGPGFARPLVPAALGFAAGIALAGVLPLAGLPPWLPLGASLPLFAAVALRPRWPPVALPLALALVAAAGGFWRARLPPVAGPADPRDALGCIHVAPAAPPRAAASGLRVRAVPAGAADGTAAADLNLRVFDRRTALWPGRVYRVCTPVHPEPLLGNPADARKGGTRGPRFGTAIGRADQAVPLFDGPQPGRLEVWRWQTVRQIERAAGPNAGPVLQALLVGVKGGLDPGVRAAFAATGTAHILAISGLHLGLLALWVHVVLRAALRRVPGLAARLRLDRLVALLTLAVALLFTLWSGATPPVVRACVMLASVLIARAVGRRPDLASALAIAALVVLAIDPSELPNASFQLSFGAVCGLGLGAEPGRRLATRLAPALTRVRPRLRTLGGYLGSLFWASTVATLATIPFTLAHFEQMAPLGPLINLVAVPLATFVVLPLGLVALLLTWLFPGLAAVWFAPAAWGTERLLDLIEVYAEACPALACNPEPVALAGVALVCLALIRLPVRPRRYGLLVLCGLCLLGAPPLARALAAAPTTTRVTFLNVRHGLSVVVQAADGRALLYDGGGRRGDDGATGEALVVPNLRALGVTTLAAVVASHDHADHLNGLIAVVRDVPSASLYLPADPRPGTPERQRLLALARARGTAVEALAPGTERHLFFGATALTLRRPIVGAAAARNENNHTLVLDVRHGARAVLLTGDIETEAEAALLDGGLARADVMLVAHHGSPTSTSPEFVARAAPRAVVVSRGEDDARRDPDPLALATCRAAGAVVFDTARDGAVQLVTDGRGLLIGSPGRAGLAAPRLLVPGAPNGIPVFGMAF